ncbi:hypothetical protein MTP03_03690 [Tsukamurella sp. PLM1]|nr:hypothetical protein MTP03_03690 [Tsukamurella sp. PLM1]
MPHGVAVPVRDVGGPRGELRPVPLEPVIGVPQPYEVGVEGVVLAVGRRDHDGAGPGSAEHDVLERTEPRRIDVLDHLHEHRRIEGCEAVVLVGESGLEQVDPAALALGHVVEMQALRGALQRAD